MTIAYIAHPVGGDVEKNLADLRRIIRRINLEYVDIVPYCPYYADVVSLNDSDPIERQRGIMNGMHTLRLANQLWLTGDHISDGMRTEIDEATALGIEVVNKIGMI